MNIKLLFKNVKSEEKKMLQRNYKLKPDKQDMRYKIYYATTINLLSKLPKSIDIRNSVSPIVDQGELGSCTDNAIASRLGAYLYKQLKFI